MDARNRRTLKYTFIAAILIIIMLFSGYKILNYVNMMQRAEKYYEDLQANSIEKDSVLSNMSEMVEEATKPIKLYPDLQLDMEELKEINSDFRGWIYYPGLEISYPIVQGEDNDYYLHHSFAGEDLYSGCIFMDCGANPDWKDRNTFVFGHNMRDNSMFGMLTEMVADTKLCEDNSFFYIYTEDAVYTYEVFSYYVVESSSDRFMLFTEDATYDTYVKEALRLSAYQNDVDFSERNNIVTLSTCYGATSSDRRLLVHGIQIRKENY